MAGTVDRSPPIEPYDTGMMAAGDGHRVYWETSGNPTGTPVLILHGGPGSGTTPGGRRNWDPDRYLIIQMDQRNCGRSTLLASDPTVRSGVPDSDRDGDLVAAYNRLLNESGDVEVQRSAAQGWCDWEDALVSWEPGCSPGING